MCSVPMVTSPRHSIWGSHIQSLLCAFSQTQYLVAHVHSLQDDVISQILYLGHMSTVSSVNPYPESVRSDQISRSVMSDSLRPHESQHARPPCPSPSPGLHSISLSITNSQSLLKLMSMESVMPSNHLILCRPCLLLPSIFPSIRVFSNNKTDGCEL